MVKSTRVPRAVALVLGLGMLVSCGSNGTDTEPSPSTSAAPEHDLVTGARDQTLPAHCGADFLASLTGRQKLAQLLNVGVTGTADAVDVVRKEQIGGIFIGSWTDESMLARKQVPQVEAVAKVPLMVSIDEEGGRVSRVADLLGEDPPPRTVAETMTPEQTYEMALERGRGLRGLGITVDYAPVVDVSSQPANSVIGDRSFSDDPDVVTEYAGEYARGLRDAGLLPVIKHFPGHGAASGDSHTGAVTTPPLDQLQTRDLVPFRELVDTGVGVMVGHLEVPGLTAPGVPASISPAAMNLLRTGTGYGAPPFDGPIFTDDLSGMRAITDKLDTPQAVAAALTAGADVALWLTTDEVPEVLDHLEELVASGRLSQQHVDDSVLRVARAKGVVTC
ncbi:glycoside hydrolase family 3 N-terminal domain-containing protein [Rhodococcus sp. UNC363MFTsu5.1]|uniref:glycoside hydrolase family 3 N-terminal domain-containing protein n=1 Tax=Rhodococcus sp. UNC363MFTsu5.1 TaxID=1449069 RepID=UPI0006894CFA|nr:glycoside hydrolase family 3 N-terminal domain-containing protein [Rhodococcus sp. UNC363MFTsu5.1]